MYQCIHWQALSAHDCCASAALGVLLLARWSWLQALGEVNAPEVAVAMVVDNFLMSVYFIALSLLAPSFRHQTKITSNTDHVAYEAASSAPSTVRIDNTSLAGTSATAIANTSPAESNKRSALGLVVGFAGRLAAAACCCAAGDAAAAQLGWPGGGLGCMAVVAAVASSGGAALQRRVQWLQPLRDAGELWRRVVLALCAAALQHGI